MRILTIAVTLFAIGLDSPSASANPFTDLTKGGKAACFRRDYDATHLRKNPRQQTTSMVVWIAPDQSVGLATVRRGDSQVLFLSGACEWGDFKSVPDWMKSFKKKAGAGCITLAVPDVFVDVSSAEEGGAVVLDPAAGGSTLTVHLGETQSMVTRANRGRKISVAFGADDRVFLLRRTDVSDCDSIKEALTTPEPGAGAR